MPQLTIYLDERSEQLIDRAAKHQSLSLSRWAREKLLLAAGSASWPQDYAQVLGSVSDPSFLAPPEPSAERDQKVDFG
jgi:hypothetical protein